MKTKLLLSLLLILFVGNCFGQVMFQKVIITPLGCQANAVQQTTDGGYIITGDNFDTLHGISDIYLAKTNAEGNILWTKTFREAKDNEGWSVQQTTDGGYIVVASNHYLNLDGNLYVVKTDPLGQIAWIIAYGGTKADEAFSVQQTNDGGYIIAGLTNSFGAGDVDVFVLKIDSTGGMTWNKTYGGSSYDYGECVKQTSDSGYIIVGYTSSFGAGGYDVYLIKTNLNGDTLWTKTYGGIYNDFGNSVQQTFDGGYIVAGYTDSFGAVYPNVYLIKTDVDGDTLWTKFYGGTIWAQGYDVYQTSDSGYIISGSTINTGSGDNNVYLIKTNANGDTLWTKSYGGTAFAEGNSVRQTIDGGYIIAGKTYSFNPQQQLEEAYLIKTDANGNSGCYQDNTSTIVGSTNTQVESTNTIVGSGGIANLANTIIGSGGNDSTLCLVIGINELSINNIISIYPNPATNELTIKNAEFRIKNIAIYNVLGQEVQGNQYSIINSQYSINVSPLASGIYFVRVAGERDVWVGKFVKE